MAKLSTTDIFGELKVSLNAKVTGDLTVNGGITTTGINFLVTTGTNSRTLLQSVMADNDFFRILVGGTASNSGFVELATADDGAEPIYVRQYTGVFTSLTRSATLLDSNGNTSFPGTVTAASFSGNASSASSVSWIGVSSKPTTLAGYGITDAAAASHNHTTAEVAGLDTALDAALVGKASLAGSSSQVFNTANLNVTGDINVTGDVFYDLSDERLKTQFKAIEDPMSKILSLDTGFYYYNDTAKNYGFDKENRQVGVKAQQVKEILPEAVALAPFDNNNGMSKSGEEYLTVRYEKLVPLLIEALKAQQKEIELLKEKVGGF